MFMIDSLVIKGLAIEKSSIRRMFISFKHGENHRGRSAVDFLITYLVGGVPTPLKNMSSSIGMMKFPIYGKKYEKKVPNHQPVTN